MGTYWMRAQWANVADIRRAADDAEADAMRDAGYTRVTRDGARRIIADINERNARWGSGAPIGRLSFAALCNPHHADHRAYSAAAYIADTRAYAGY